MIRRLLINKEIWGKTAVIDGKKQILYGDIAQKMLAIQQVLPQGNRENIAVFLPNSGDYIAAFFGVLLSGMTAFPLNTRMTKYEFIPLLEQTSTGIVITSKIFHEIFDSIITPHLQILYIEELHTSECEDLPEVANVLTDEPMILLGTSGTTGKSKIVQLSEKNVETAVLGYIDKMNFDEEDSKDIRFVLASPFSSIYGIMILSACLMESFPIVLMNDNFTLNAFYKTVEENKVTHYEGGSLPILMMERMVGRPIPYDISLLTNFGFGGSKVSGNTIKTVLHTYPGIACLQGYGMTEAAPLITKHNRVGMEKVESVGMAIKGVEIAVEVDDRISDVPYIKGEIVVKGENVMLGYYKNEAETNKVLKNGYLYTGDIGYLDEDGYLYICGRKKNIIIVRGFNVHAEEIETCILNSFLVKECFVYGKTDDLGSEMVCADVVLMNPQVKTEDIEAYCNSRLSAYKHPQRIYICDTIKKTISGKTERRKEESQ